MLYQLSYTPKLDANLAAGGQFRPAMTKTPESSLPAGAFGSSP